MLRVLVGLLALMTLASHYSAAMEKPNFIIIFVDDLGYADITPFGATKQRTPNLERMAKDGLKLTSFYAAPVCSVSRAQLLTGCYGARISVPGVFFPAGPQGLNPKEQTIAKRLQPLGYSTACIGKWHLGDQPEFLPTKHGFDHYFGIPYSNDMQRVATATGERVVPLLRNDEVVDLLTDERQSQIVERYTEDAVKFITQNREKPFFLYYAHTAVHTPIYPGEKFRGKSKNGRFGDWVEEVDWSVGQILDSLESLKLTKNTLVLFTSDNGPWLIKGADGGSALPLRGGKGSTWEGGVRVPTIVQWPGKISAGSFSDVVAGTIDLLPTILTLAGGKVAPEPVIDGRDLSTVLFGTSQQSPREAHYYFSGYELQAIRQGPWKLALMPQPETMGKGVANDAKANPRLYNLDREISEQTNLADQHPDIVAKLTELANKKKAEIGGSTPLARRPAGSVANPKTLYPTVEPKKKNSGKPANLATLKPGDTVSSTLAPQIANKPFSIECQIQTAQADTILLAHGGLIYGYALHLRQGHVVFTVRTGANAEVAEVQCKSLAGQATIRATLAQDGTMTLKVGDQPPVTGKAAGLIAKQPQEDFCLGHDNSQAITNYGEVKPFKGQLTGLKITTP